ncbi:MAG TPA: pyridoxal phosphate-dependent aminotransferase [Thiotrichales bacterium]|nr:pyridoxal phosphate-dependent aminotransferase [Thiotrichales bacterium]
MHLSNDSDLTTDDDCKQLPGNSRAPSPVSQRSGELAPFHVMAILDRARQLEAQGRSIIHLEVGEPDFATPASISAAGIGALNAAKTHYTAASGLPELRQAVADYYRRRFNLAIDAKRIIITPGASGALQLALLSLLDVGQRVLLSDPGYPCNRNIAQLLGIKVDAAPVSADTRYQLDAAAVAQYWQADTRAAMVATPSNPTGTIIPGTQLAGLLDAVKDRGGHLIVDEIYQGLVYDVADSTVLSLSDECFVINSFSKYFGMTGWRLGWMVVPEAFSKPIDRISQNIFLAPSTIAQHAALVALQAETEKVLQQRRDEFKCRRDFLLPALTAMGFKVPVRPEGAFYIYAQCDAFTDNSFDWSGELLEQQGVAITPGVDFGDYDAHRYCRFAYTRPVEVLAQAVERIGRFIGA